MPEKMLKHIIDFNAINLLDRYNIDKGALFKKLGPNSYISGSFPLQCITGNFFDIEHNPAQHKPDLDIYCTPETYKELKQFLLATNYESQDFDQNP